VRPPKTIQADRACAGKRVFRTRGAVRRALADGRARRTLSGDLGFYRCPFGAHFHLGHPLGSDERKTG
jgi:hypothetical protein